MDTIDIEGFDDVSLEHLSFLAKSVSLENFSAPGTLQPNSARLGSFFNGIKAFFKRTKFADVSNIDLPNIDVKNFMGLTAKSSFMAMGDKDIYVPEGFIGKWLPYALYLQETTSKATKLEQKVTHLNNLLGGLLNDFETMSSKSGVGGEDVNLGLDESVRHIGKTFFDGSTEHIHRKLGAVIDRSQDVQDTQKAISAISKMDKSIDKKKLLQYIDRSADLGARLAERIGSSKTASKAATEEVIDLVLTLAKEVEAYGILTYRVRQFSLAVQDSLKIIK